jgi:hypothetical protein
LKSHDEVLQLLKNVIGRALRLEGSISFIYNGFKIRAIHSFLFLIFTL